MKTIAFLSQKGGSGKTTLAVHSAVAALEGGEVVLVIDTDAQKSAATWREARTEQLPLVAAVPVSQLHDVMVAASNEGVAYCIVDTAPHATPEAARIAGAVDLVVIPCRPTAFDLAAAGNAVQIARAAKARAVFVLSACPFRAPEISETRLVLEGYGFPVSPAEITDRRAFARAVATGRAVTEFESEGKAAEEIRALWNWIKEQLDNEQ